MKKWIFLLAIPYVVVSQKLPGSEEEYGVRSASGGIIQCQSDKEMCEDMAEALNQAHCKKRENRFKSECAEIFITY